MVLNWTKALFAVKLLGLVITLTVLLSSCSVDASKAQIKDCKAALKVTVHSSVVTKKPALCDVLTDRQYGIVVKEVTRKFRVAESVASVDASGTNE